MMKPPCGKYCPDRTADCHSTCEKWQEYERERNKDYEERYKKYVALSYFSDVVRDAQHRKHMRRRK